MQLTHTQLDLLEPGAHNAPLNRIDSLNAIEFEERGVYRFQEDLTEKATLDYLLDFRGSDTLLVILHGATDRSSYQMPRFEWLGTVSKNTDFNSVYFSDPVLSVDEKIQLAWYTGWKDLDCHKIIADRIHFLKKKNAFKTYYYRRLFRGRLCLPNDKRSPQRFSVCSDESSNCH